MRTNRFRPPIVKVRAVVPEAAATPQPLPDAVVVADAAGPGWPATEPMPAVVPTAPPAARTVAKTPAPVRDRVIRPTIPPMIHLRPSADIAADPAIL